MPRKKADLGRKTAAAKRSEANRAAETPEQREKRLARIRLSNRIRRAAETPEQREARSACARLRYRMKSAKTPGPKTSQAQQQKAKRAAETPKQRLASYARDRWKAVERQRAKRAAETPEQREARLANVQLRARIRRSAETPGPKPSQAQRQKAKRASETHEQREKRLASVRLRARMKRATETLEQRLARYARGRWKAVERQRAKRAAETPEQREARLASDRLRNRMKRAAQTPLKPLAHYDPSINMDPNFDPTEFLTIKEEFLPNDVDIHATEQAQFTQINGNLNVQMPPEAEITHDNCDQSGEMEFITPKTEVYIEGYELQEQELHQKQMQLNNKDIDHHQKHS